MKTLRGLVLPLVLIPVVLSTVRYVGHDVANALMGLVFFIALTRFADHNERIFMVLFSVFSVSFDTGYVALGFYKFANTSYVPLWNTLGWSVVGLYILKNRALLNRVKHSLVYAFLTVFYGALWILTGTQASALVFYASAVLAVYVLSLTFKWPPALFAFASLMGVLVEFTGTATGIWTYYSGASAAAPPLGFSGMGYASLLAFIMWLSRMEPAGKHLKGG